MKVGIYNIAMVIASGSKVVIYRGMGSSFQNKKMSAPRVTMHCRVYDYLSGCQSVNTSSGSTGLGLGSTEVNSSDARNSLTGSSIPILLASSVSTLIPKRSTGLSPEE